MKIVKIVALVRDEDAEEVKDGYLNLATFDASVGAYTEINDLTTDDRQVFGPLLEDIEEEA